MAGLALLHLARSYTLFRGSDAPRGGGCLCNPLTGNEGAELFRGFFFFWAGRTVTKYAV